MENTKEKRHDTRKRGELARAAGRRVISFEAPNEFHKFIGSLADVMETTRADALIQAALKGGEIILAKSKKK